MIIKENVVAGKAVSILGSKEAESKKLMKKLSLGEQITCAADDASGLAISEKMRAQIRGLNQAVENSKEGQSFLRTGEGALTEVEEELQRMREMAVHSANGTLTESDRETMQKEFAMLGEDIDRIAKDTEFNTIPVFEYDEPKPQAVKRQVAQAAAQANNASVRTVADIMAATKSGDFNLFYDEVTYDFTTTQTPNGPATDTAFDATGIKSVLQNEMVPNVVENILQAYPAFGYLSGSSLGIGLNLYSDPSSSVLASVTAGTGGQMTNYKLSINMATVNLANASSRSELERTVAHEMIHAFMDESLTKGMLGSDRFPLWFIEGMAQTASGPGNWVKASGGLGLNASSTNAQIQAALQAHTLGSVDNAANYGSGYLAAMYLGYKANGGGAVTAQGVSNGLSKILAEVIDGKSLNDTFAALTGYASVNTFASSFATDVNAQNFVRDLLTATGSGAGGVVSGNLTETNLISNNPNTGPNVNLFKLNTSQEWVRNDYPSNVTVGSGGGLSTSGNEPIAGYDPSAIPPVGGTTTTPPGCDFSITTAVSGGFTYDATNKILTISSPGNYSISMATLGSITGARIVVQNGANVTLDGVGITTTSGPAIKVEGTSTITLRGDNRLTTTGAGSDAIALDAGAALTINGAGLLAASGANNGIAGGNSVKIQSGTVIANGTAGKDIDSGSLLIEGGSVAVNKAKLNPPPTKDGTVPVYQHVFGGPPPNPLIDNAATITAGGKTFSVSPDNANHLSLWLEGIDQAVDVTDVNGVKKTYYLKFDPVTSTFSAANKYPDNLFTVNGTDMSVAQPGMSFDPSTGVLTITAAGNYKISGGKSLDLFGADVVGKIVVAPGITGSVDITFDEVDIDQSANAGVAAMSIGAGSNVVLTLADGKNNTLISGSNKAGLEVGNGANLTIRGETAGNGKLIAEGSASGAGIGGSYQSRGGNIKIDGGIIEAYGGNGAAGIGAGNEGSIGTIEITGGTIKAKSVAHGAGIGGGWSPTSNGKITISGGTITAISTEHGTGIGAGCGGFSADIEITGGDITAQGGNNGAGIGASWTGRCGNIIISGAATKINATGGTGGAGIGAGEGTCGQVTITDGQIKAQGGTGGAGIGAGYGSVGKMLIEGGVIEASGGQYGAGIGSGERGKTSDIEITGGVVNATGSTDATGIGSGRWATGTGSIKITGGSVTATGGMTPPGNDIGVFEDSIHTKPRPIEIGATTVKSGNGNSAGIAPGEGKVHTTGAKNAAGKPIYAYPLDLSFVTPPATVTKIDSVGNPSADTGLWNGTPPEVIWHVGPDGTTPTGSSYIWMTGEEQTVTVTLSDGTTKVLDLVFHDGPGVFRPRGDTPPPTPDVPGNPSNPDPVIPLPPIPPTPTPDPLPEDPPIRLDPKGLILQIGPNSHQIMILQRFWLSMRALDLQFTDIATQDNAEEAIDAVDKAIDKVSSMRGTYGAYDNRLDHVISSNENTALNLTDSESCIRDTNMAKTIMSFQLIQIQTQAAQSMLAQANQMPQQVLQLLK